MAKPIPRYITNLLFDALKVSPVVFLNGIRQSGKSTLVQGLANEIGQDGDPAIYVSFDSATQMAAAATAPETFLKNHTGRLIIDEVQLVPELFRVLKIVVDELRLRQKEYANGKYLLTGSANILALPKLSDPLVGRMVVLTLYPFSSAESTKGKGNGLEKILAMDFTGLSERDISLVDAIKLSTFPEISDKAIKERNIWFDGYLTTILQRDVKQLAELEKITLLPTLLRVLSARAGGLINDSDISREVGLNSVTGKFYRNILKMMFLTFDVRPWYRNVGKRLVKAAKGYITDTALLCHMLELDIDEIYKSKPDLFGHIVENFVATELTKLLTFSNIRAQLFHFRTSDGKEVDFVLEKPDGRIFGIEIKKSGSVTAGDFKGLRALQELSEKEFMGGIVLYSGADVVPFGKNLWAVPFYILWQ